MTAEPVVIRPRDEADLPALVDALRVVAAADGYPTRWPDDPSAWLRSRQVSGAWVAQRAGELVGHVVLRAPRDDPPVRMWCAQTGAEPDTCGVVVRLFVAPHARGLGIGSALLDATCREAVSRGVDLVLEVADQDTLAVRLYQHLGWRPIGSHRKRFSDHRGLELLHCYAAPLGAGNRVTSSGDTAAPVLDATSPNPPRTR